MAEPGTGDVRVWDRAVRVSHGLLVVAVGVSALGTTWFVAAHQPAGYVAVAVVLARIGWGFGPDRYARFAHFVRAPRGVWRYAVALARGREPRHVGHNPLGGWMALALFACVLGLGLTGWLYTTDLFWADETVERLHVALAWTLLVLVSLHVIGVLFASLRHRENLVAAMFDGRKRAPRDGDID